MSASWGSEVRSGRVGGRARDAATGVLLAIALGLVPALALAASDSGRVVRHVRIGPAGIQIERSGPGDSTGRMEIAQPQGPRGCDQGGSARVDRGDPGERGRRERGRRWGRFRERDLHRRGHRRRRPGAVVRRCPRARREDHPRGRGGRVRLGGCRRHGRGGCGGRVRLGAPAHAGRRVEGDAIAIGGVLDQPAGRARERPERGRRRILSPGWGVPTLATLLTVVFLGWLVTLILGWLLALLFSERMLQIGSTASRHSAGSFFLGLLSAPLFVIALVLLFITVVGIPFALLLPFVYLLAIWAGQVAGSYVLGCKILRRRPGEGGLMGADLRRHAAGRPVLRAGRGACRARGVAAHALALLHPAGSAAGRGALDHRDRRADPLAGGLAPRAGSVPARRRPEPPPSRPRAPAPEGRVPGADARRVHALRRSTRRGSGGVAGERVGIAVLAPPERRRPR